MKKLFIIFILSVTAFSCKRYEENPALVFGSVRGKMNENWEIDKVYLNNELVPSVFDTYTVSNYDFLIASKKEKKDKSAYFDGGFVVYSGTTYLGVATIKLDDDLTGFSIYSDYPWLSVTANLPATLVDTSYTIVEGAFLREKWEIIKLTNKEFWIKTSYNGKSYETHFKKREE